MRGRRRSPGRPVTYGTTMAFLDHFGLEDLRDLPGMDELKGAGLLSGTGAFQLPDASMPLNDDELT
jgi:segregation and condensation protein B